MRCADSAHWLIANVLERLAALVVLLVLTPLLLMVAIATALLSRRSPLIAHRRVGFGGQPLWLLKFRTMWQPDEASAAKPALVEYIVDEHGPRKKQAQDKRISSRFARFCRRHSIDELPQLLHVLRGEMSFVGPRPVTASEWELHYHPHALDVLEVKPGLSGLWQIMGRNRLSYEERRDLDLVLVRNLSPKLYFQILWWTVPEVLSGRNSW